MAVPVCLCLVIVAATVGMSSAAVVDVVPRMETVEDLLNALAQVTESKDEVRCHCNLPVCVTTGYMCKSTVGTCFSEIVDRNDPSKSRHGCIELISSDPKVCYSQQDDDESEQLDRPLVLCCQDDLCNYAAQHVQHHRHRVGAGHSGNHHHRGNETSAGVELRVMTTETTTSTANAAAGHDLWLKAATIAVPIAGGCILVLLVLLAIRMLRRDREQNGIITGSGINELNGGSGGGYILPTHRTDFQIRSVWGNGNKGGYHHPPSSQQQQWKPSDRRTVYHHQQNHQFAPLLQQHNIVYLPTVHKIATPKKMMWNKSFLVKNPVLQHV